MFPNKMSFLKQLLQNTILWHWIIHRLFVVNWAMILATWKENWHIWWIHLSFQWSSQPGNCKHLMPREHRRSQRITSIVWKGYNMLWNVQNKDYWSILLRSSRKWWKLPKNASLLCYTEDIRLARISDFRKMVLLYIGQLMCKNIWIQNFATNGLRKKSE